MSVEAAINYLDALPAEKPAFYFRPRGPEDTRKHPVMDSKSVSIHDARALPDLSLDVHGVELVAQRSRVADFYDHDDVRATYYPEVEALVREHVGARRVLVFDHNLRSQPRAERGEPDVQMPVRFAHNDYTNDSGPQRVRDLLPDEAGALLERRFAVINVWRPFHVPAETTPLAVCDAASLPEAHLVPMDLVYPDRLGEIQSVLWDEGHRWLYFPDMQPEEVMLLKCFDSARDGRARFTAHSAFDDPNTREGAPPRESIEVRTLAFF